MRTSPFAPGVLIGLGSEATRFAEVLNAEGVLAHQIPFFRHWVERWIAFAEIGRSFETPEAFAAELAREGKADWQCEQALRAVRLWQSIQVRSKAETVGIEEASETANWTSIIDRMRTNLVGKRYSPCSVKAYLEWGRRLAFFHPQPPTNSVAASRMVQSYLEYLAVEKNLAPASIDQARNALAWLVRNELGFELRLGSKGDSHHAKKLPTILAPKTVKRILAHCDKPWDLFFGLQYGCGLRLGEVLDLRIHDLDFERGVLFIRAGKGDKDRQVPLPRSLFERLKIHLETRRELWRGDLSRGCARVDLPHALARKIAGADLAWEWQHVFGAARPLRYPETNELRRWRPLETVVRAALRDAAHAAGVIGRIHPHLLRHCYATHLVELGVPLAEIKELMGHARLETTMVYLHVCSPAESLRSPLDRDVNVVDNGAVRAVYLESSNSV